MLLSAAKAEAAAESRVPIRRAWKVLFIAWVLRVALLLDAMYGRGPLSLAELLRGVRVRNSRACTAVASDGRCALAEGSIESTPGIVRKPIDGMDQDAGGSVAYPRPRASAALASLGAVRAFPKNAVIIQEGDHSDQLYVVLAGRLKVYLADPEGKELVVDMLGPGKYFGEMALDGEARSASVMTVEPARLAVVERPQFVQFLHDHPDAAFELIVTLIRRARNLTRAVGSLGLLDVYGRVARLLLDNAHQEDGRMVVSRMTQQDMANRVGASREMVWRILDDLRAGGYISNDDGRIVIRQSLPRRW
jgi:CRP/FNR family cyclic AMP-dependent transcriptional regulator